MGYEHFRLDDEDIINHAKSKGNKSDWYRSAVMQAYQNELNEKAEKKKEHIEVVING